MVGLSRPSLQAILCVLVASSAASPGLRATGSAVPLPAPPAGSQVVYVGATDPGIVWSSGWQTGPSPCSSDETRTASGTSSEFESDSSNYPIATYSFRGTGIYANLQSGNAMFAITVDEVQTSFGIDLPVPANCSFDWSATNLADDTDHEFRLFALGSSLSTNSFWTLGLEGLALIQPASSNSSSTNSTSSATSNPSIVPSGAPSAQSSSTGTNSSPSPSSSATKSGGGLGSSDVIAIVTSIIGGVASLFAIIAGILQFRKWREAKRRSPSQDYLSGVVQKQKENNA
ncbi:hypothetical protein B0H12DRAFT_1237820 [Mycena haematopus]|nr:hypothetical protein B0H12DRAFT_1237820 [Mycena haematopus]